MISAHCCKDLNFALKFQTFLFGCQRNHSTFSDACESEVSSNKELDNGSEVCRSVDRGAFHGLVRTLLKESGTFHAQLQRCPH